MRFALFIVLVEKNSGMPVLAIGFVCCGCVSFGNFSLYWAMMGLAAALLVKFRRA